MKQQGSLFRRDDATNILHPNTEPYQHQISRSVANSAIAFESHKRSQYHISQKGRVKAFLMANPKSTLDEISYGTGITQKGTITARFNDLRKEGWDLVDNHGYWSIRKRIL